MAKYLRWRKKEGQWPRWGPYMVIRREVDNVDWWTKTHLVPPEVNLSLQLGLYWVNLFHFQVILAFVYEQYYWEVF